MEDKILNILQVNIATVESKADVIIVDGKPFFFKNTGLTRRVFVNEEKTLVVKVPITDLDFRHNQNEADTWKNGDDDVKKELAESHLLPNGFLIQEYLHTIDDDATEEWLGRPLTMSEIHFSQSCRNEVGFDADGNLKCYDYDEYKRY